MLYELFVNTKYSCFANHADDTTPYVISSNLKEVVSDQRDINEKLFMWFSLNKGKVSLSKGHILLSSPESPNLQISTVNNSKQLLTIEEAIRIDLR